MCGKDALTLQLHLFLCFEASSCTYSSRKGTEKGSKANPRIKRSEL